MSAGQLPEAACQKGGPICKLVELEAGYQGLQAGGVDETQMQHGKNWTGQEVTGWWAMEKFNGCRAYWDGQALWNRAGRQIKLPAAFAAQLPAMVLDGEIYGGPDRKGFNRAAALVKRDKWSEGLRFVVFDAPEVDGPWIERIRAARAGMADTVETIQVTSMAQVRAFYLAVTRRGGEGLMIMDPQQHRYFRQRTDTLLKVKRYPGTIWNWLVDKVAA